MGYPGQEYNEHEEHEWVYDPEEEAWYLYEEEEEESEYDEESEDEYEGSYDDDDFQDDDDDFYEEDTEDSPSDFIEPPRDYEGWEDERGFHVRINMKEELLSFPVYTKTREWKTVDGVYQLAIDLLLDYIGESPASASLTRKEEGIAAWLPHLEYISVIIKIIHIARGRHWFIRESQIKFWLDNWMFQVHAEKLKARGSYDIPLTFDDWKKALCKTPDYGTTYYSLAWLYRAYLYGYSIPMIFS